MDSITIYEESFANIAVCRKLRRLGKLENIRLDESEHRFGGLNRHLFDYIEYAGMDVLEFVKKYISNLQPYMIERRKDQEKDMQHIVCVVDNLYRLSIYIKVNDTQHEEVIVSFHEDYVPHKRPDGTYYGVTRSNAAFPHPNDRFVPVFADSENAFAPEEDRYGVKVFIQRGLKVYPVELVAKKYKDDVYIVNERMIEQFLLDNCNTYIRDLYVSNLDIDFSQIDMFTALQQLSFSSYGNDTFSTLSLLIDSFEIQKDVISRQVADSALVTFSQNLKLSDAQRQEIIALLETKFAVSSIKDINILLSRIEDNLAIKYLPPTETEIINTDTQNNDLQTIHDVVGRNKPKSGR